MLGRGRAVLLHGGHEVRAAGYQATILALVAALLLAASVARADDGLTHGQATLDGARMDRVHVQPTANQFAGPDLPDVSPSSARAIDELYEQLTGPKPPVSFAMKGESERSRPRRSAGESDAVR
jgi:hypothetical protein